MKVRSKEDVVVGSTIYLRAGKIYEVQSDSTIDRSYVLTKDERGQDGVYFKTRFDTVEEDADFILTRDSQQRKETPIFSGVANYFPLALAAIARLSFAGNKKHNPGEELHWARSKSDDHADAIARHLIDHESKNAEGEYEDAACLAWRALALLQILEEKRLGKGPSRGSKI